MKAKLVTLSLILPMPFLMFSVYGVLRIMYIAPPMETGMSELMTTLFLWSGATICYFVMAVYGAFRFTKQYLTWLSASSLLALLAFDETFMIHETLSTKLDIAENHVFAFYGVLFIGILLLFRHSTRLFWLGVFGFILFCGISQTADTLVGEGIITIAGREIDYEQVFEALGTLCLCFAFSFQAFEALISSGFKGFPMNHSNS